MRLEEEKTDSSHRSHLFRFNGVLLSLLLFFGILYLGKALFIPFFLALLFAMLMTPVSNWLERHSVPKWLAVMLCIIALLSVLAGLAYFIGSQVTHLTEDLPELQERVMERVEEVRAFVERNFGITLDRENLPESGTATNVATRVVFGVFHLVFNFGLILVYIYLLIFYRRRLQRFIVKVFKAEERETTRSVIQESGKVAQHYLGGIFIVCTILAILNTTALMVIGVEHAVLFGVIAGYLNFIPFIGTVLGSLLPITMALLTEDSVVPALLVAANFAFNQFLEESVLTPYFVGSKVNINPLAVVLAIIVGNLMWGVAGIVIFIPFIAIAKIIFDHVESLRPYGYVLGSSEDDDNSDTTYIKLKKWFNRTFNRSVGH
ncbi:AI-2E family transporter [soil metagenome]